MSGLLRWALRNPAAAALSVLLVILLGALARQSWALHRLRADVVQATTERDSLAAEAAAERARAEGWTVRFAEEVERLGAELERRDSLLARLSRDYRASRIRLVELLAMTATATGSVEAAADSSLTATDACEGRWAGKLDDGLLRASWTFWTPPPVLRLEYEATVPIEIVSALAGDGRRLVSARSPDERVRLEVRELLFDPPTPQVVYRASWPRLLIASLVGFGLQQILR